MLTETSTPRARHRGRFVALDGLRGVAALLVLCLHLDPLKGLVPHGYLAVDLFFLMSGFVVALAYEDRLRGDWSLVDFLQIRVVRLWPLYLLGTLIGAAVFASVVDGPMMAAGLALMIVAAIVLIPLPLGADVQIFNLNRPAWSLFFEMVANLLYGAFGARMGVRALAAVSAVGAALVILTFTAAGTGSLGHHGDSLVGGLARILFAFPFGVILYRLWRAGRWCLRAPIFLILPVFVGVLAAPDLGALNGVFDAVVVLLVFPPLVALAVNAPVGPRSGRMFAALADLSYPLYILHGPIIMGFAQLGDEHPAMLLAGGVASLAFAGFAARRIDPVGRGWLARLLPDRRPCAGGAVHQEEGRS